MKCIYIIKFNGNAPTDVSKIKTEIYNIKEAVIEQYWDILGNGIFWVIDIADADQSTYRDTIAEIVGTKLNGLPHSISGESIETANLAKWASISFDDLMTCFIPLRDPTIRETRDSTNMTKSPSGYVTDGFYAILPKFFQTETINGADSSFPILAASMISGTTLSDDQKKGLKGGIGGHKG